MHTETLPWYCYVVARVLLPHTRYKEVTTAFKGAVSNFLTVLKHKNTIVLLHIFILHTCFSEKQCYRQLFCFENVCSVSECLFCFGLSDSTNCQFTQYYFSTPGCQLVETQHIAAFEASKRKGASCSVILTKLMSTEPSCFMFVRLLCRAHSWRVARSTYYKRCLLSISGLVVCH